MNVVWKIMAAALVAIYPLVIYFGIQHFEPKILALFLLVVLALRYFSSTTSPVGGNTSKLVVLGLGVLLISLTFYYNSLGALKLYPVLVNSSLLIVFVASLYYPPSVIERFARMQEPDLPAEGVIYTNKVTKVWCLFFIINGGIAFYTAIFASTEIWTLYNGLISYLLMGVLFVGEFIYRKLVIIPKQ